MKSEAWRQNQNNFLYFLKPENLKEKTIVVAKPSASKILRFARII